MNNATCVVRDKSYECVCSGEFTGVNCEFGMSLSVRACLSGVYTIVHVRRTCTMNVYTVTHVRRACTIIHVRRTCTPYMYAVHV